MKLLIRQPSYCRIMGKWISLCFPVWLMATFHLQSQQRQVKGVSQCTLLIFSLLACKWWFCLVYLYNSGWTTNFKLTCLATSIPCNLTPYHQVTGWSQESILGGSLGKHHSTPCSNSSRSLSCRKNQRSRKSLKAAMSNRNLNLCCTWEFKSPHPHCTIALYWIELFLVILLACKIIDAIASGDRKFRAWNIASWKVGLLLTHILQVPLQWL